MYNNIFLLYIFYIIFPFFISFYAFFTQTVVNTLKTGQTIFKLLFFGIGILAIVVIIFDTPKFIKIIFFMFPHIAHIQNLQIIYLLQISGKLEFKLFFSSFHGINYFESFLFLIFDILIFMYGGFLVLLYKDSGVNFFSFILSPIYGKKRKINEENKVNKKLISFDSFHENRTLNEEKNQILK